MSKQKNNKRPDISRGSGPTGLTRTNREKKLRDEARKG